MLSGIAFLLVGAPTLRKVAEGNVEAFRKAIVAHNVAWFERTLAPDYVQIVDGAKIKREPALATMRKGLLRMPTTGLTAKILQFKPRKTGYTVTVAFDGTLNAQLQGRPAKLHAKWRDAQVWKPVKGRWLLASTSTTNFEQTIE